MWIMRTFSADLVRVLFNQFVISAFLYNPLYFGITGPMQGLTARETLQRFRERFPSLFGLSLLFWFPVQYGQFACVPTRYKVPFICMASLVWNTILSALAGSAASHRSAPATKTTESGCSLDDRTRRPDDVAMHGEEQAGVMAVL